MNTIKTREPLYNTSINKSLKNCGNAEPNKCIQVTLNTEVDLIITVRQEMLKEQNEALNTINTDVIYTTFYWSKSSTQYLNRKQTNRSFNNLSKSNKNLYINPLLLNKAC